MTATTPDRPASPDFNNTSVLAPASPAHGRSHRTPRTFPTGSSFIGSDYSPATADAYRRIRQATDDTPRIAINTGIRQDVLDRMKRHLFLTEHEVPVGPGQVERGYFTPDDRIASLWAGATEGTLEADDLDAFRRLAAHEYVESRLMDAGMPYRSAHPDAFDDEGCSIVNPRHYGAHDIAPNEYRPDPFAHWPKYGREHPGITIADDLSNLDEVVRAALQGQR